MMWAGQGKILPSFAHFRPARWVCEVSGIVWGSTFLWVHAECLTPTNLTYVRIRVLQVFITICMCMKFPTLCRANVRLQLPPMDLPDPKRNAYRIAKIFAAQHTSSAVLPSFPACRRKVQCILKTFFSSTLWFHLGRQGAVAWQYTVRQPHLITPGNISKYTVGWNLKTFTHAFLWWSCPAVFFC